MDFPIANNSSHKKITTMCEFLNGTKHPNLDRDIFLILSILLHQNRHYLSTILKKVELVNLKFSTQVHSWLKDSYEV
jgi:hypothetical protein